MLLRKCVDDVRLDIQTMYVLPKHHLFLLQWSKPFDFHRPSFTTPSSRHDIAGQKNTTGPDLTKLYNASPGAVPFEAFQDPSYNNNSSSAFDAEEAQQHKSNLELLLSQERVVALIYAKTFPIVSKSVTALRSSVKPPAAPRGHGGELAGTDPAFPDSVEDLAASISHRPLTANAILASMNGMSNSYNGKFPPIASNNRMASR